MKVEYGKTGTCFYLVGLILVAIFLPTSKFGLSVSQFYLLALWMLLGLDMRSVNKMFSEKPFFARIISRVVLSFKGIWYNVKTRFSDFIHNRVAVIMVSMYLLHLVGLLYTSDFQYAFKDLRIKLPLLLFPLFLSSMKPLSKKHFDTVLWFFVASVFFVTILGLIKFLVRDFVDVRELSVFVSHIRLSLCIVFSILILLYFIYKRNYNLTAKVVMSLMIMIFMYFIIILESFISFFILLFLLVLFVAYCVYKSKNNIVRISSLAFFIVCLFLVIYLPYDYIKKYNIPAIIDVEKMDTHTKLGNPYVFDTIKFGIEDGRYVGMYISRNELIQAWNDRSDKKIAHEYETDYFTLVRYLTSKDLRKDAEGVSKLTDDDIVNIENGIANYNYIKNPGLKTRIMKIMVAYDNYRLIGNANGSSVFQRVEYIKASYNIIRNDILFGVGTGDIANAFSDYYEETDSKLLPEYRNRCHNQYLAITVAFGVVGLIWFLLSMLYPLFINGNYKDYFYLVFMIIMILSMFTEDTLETQIGVTIFAFFNSFLVFSSPYLQSDRCDDNKTHE